MSQLRNRYEEFRAAGAEEAVISFAQRRAMEHYARDLRIPFPLLSDPKRAAYNAYGLRKGGLWTIFGPKTVWEYVMLIGSGRLVGGIQSDPFQVGCVFVIVGSCIVRFAHRSEDPADRPAMDRLLQAVRSPAR